jgi:CHAD domain-containing protein
MDAASAPRRPAPAHAAPLARAGQELLRLAAQLSAAGALVRAGHHPTAVHDLRVAARRLEAALRVWARAALPATPSAVRAARRARLGARRLRRAAAPARELEVHVQLLDEWLLPERAEHRRTLDPVLEALRNRRDRAREELASFALARRFDRIADRVAACALAIPETPEALAQAVERAGRVRRRAEATLSAAVHSEDDATLHAARVALKKWRYAAEPLGPACPAELAPVKALRAAQQALGSVHDRATLHDLLRRQAARAARARAPRRSAALVELAAFVERARRALLKDLPRRLRALRGPLHG